MATEAAPTDTVPGGAASRSGSRQAPGTDEAGSDVAAEETSEETVEEAAGPGGGDNGGGGEAMGDRAESTTGTTVEATASPTAHTRADTGPGTGADTGPGTGADTGPGTGAEAPGRRPIPIRTMLAIAGSVLATAIAVEILLKLRQVVVWTAVSALLAAVLHPPVSLLVRKVKVARALAALIVFLAGTALVAGLGYSFVRPLAQQINVAVNDFPGYVNDAQAGRGTIGHLVKKYKVDTWVQQNQPKLQQALKSAEKPLVKLATGLLNTLTAAATIIVMTFLLLIEGPRMMEGGLAILSPPAQSKVRTVIADLVKAVAGYVGGVLTSSILAGLVSYVTLWILGVPFRGVLAVWIGFTALVPLVGIFLGIIPAAAVAFIHSTPAGFLVIVIVLGFALLENRTLGKLINTRTIDLSPLAVAVSVLAGFQLLGFLGVFLAIPAAGVIHVVVRDVWAFRHPGTAPPEPSEAASELPPTPSEAASEASPSPSEAPSSTDGAVCEPSELPEPTEA